MRAHGCPDFGKSTTTAAKATETTTAAPVTSESGTISTFANVESTMVSVAAYDLAKPERPNSSGSSFADTWGNSHRPTAPARPGVVAAVTPFGGRRGRADAMAVPARPSTARGRRCGSPLTPKLRR